MRDSICIVLIILVAFTSIGCGFHLRSKTQALHGFYAIILRGDDPYGILWNKISQQLHINNISILNSQDISINTRLPILYLSSEIQNQNTILSSQDGSIEKYSIAMSINARITIPQRGNYPINSIIYRSFLINSMQAMEKDSEKHFILNEMRQNLAEQLVHKLLLLYSRVMDKPLPITCSPIES